MIDLESDPLFPVAKLFEQRLGNRPSPAAVWRMTTCGISVHGQRVRLEAVKIGGQWRTSPKAFAAFLAAQSNRQEPQPQHAPELPADVQRRLKSAGLA